MSELRLFLFPTEERKLPQEEKKLREKVKQNFIEACVLYEIHGFECNFLHDGDKDNLRNTGN
jgi:hypothetical protein